MWTTLFVNIKSMFSGVKGESGKRLLRGIFANAFTQIIIATSQLFLVPYMAMSWGAVRYGEWLMVFTLPSYLALSNFGISTATGNMMTMQVASGDYDAAQKSLNASIFMVVPISMMFAFAIIIISNWANAAGVIKFSQDNNDFMKTVIFMVLYGVLSIYNGLLHSCFRSVGKYATVTYMFACTSLLETMFVALLVSANAKFASVALAYVLCRGGLLLMQLAVLKYSTSWIGSKLLSFSWPEARALISPSLAVVAETAAQAFYLQGSLLVVGAVVGPASAATFGAVRTLTRSGVQLSNLVSLAAMPEMSRAFIQAKLGKTRRLVLMSLVGSIVITLPISALLLLFGKEFVSLWTRGALQPKYFLIVYLVISMLATSLWYPLSRLLLSINQHGRYSYYFLFGSVLCIPLGAAAAYLTGEVGVGFVVAALDVFLLIVVARQIRGMFFSTVNERGENAEK